MRNRKQVPGSLAPSLGVVVMMEHSGSLYGKRVGAGLEVLIWDEGGVGLEKWLRPSAHPLRGAVYWDRGQHPAFPSRTSEMAVGFGPFCMLLLMICPSWACMWLFLVPYVFFVCSCLRRHLSRYKHCSRGSKVPACLRLTVGRAW